MGASKATPRREGKPFDCGRRSRRRLWICPCPRRSQRRSMINSITLGPRHLERATAPEMPAFHSGSRRGRILARGRSATFAMTLTWRGDPLDRLRDTCRKRESRRKSNRCKDHSPRTVSMSRRRCQRRTPGARLQQGWSGWDRKSGPADRQNGHGSQHHGCSNDREN